ncbi:hypothetical protein K0I63_07060 [Shewanella rhizosphaerae]|uniref:formyltransferase family protein n=1 Tax=Shewanella rhizosphaerae TaxID=2864207 RepID=UPI001C65A343|nr:formyltransferase family protein [Shewanella rhizosphaerae]QYK14256.1 hypothetical protein K0I63_07060 [Shewanella rhizosphaerae]
MTLKIVIFTQGKSRIVEHMFNNYSVSLLVNSRNSEPPLKSFLKSAVKSLFPTKIQRYCKDNNVQYFDYNGNNNDELLDMINKLNPDVGIVFSMSQLIKQDVIDSFKYGIVNIHPSYLPSYRGPNPLFQYYKNMDEVGGVTLHFIDSAADTGNIISQEKFQINKGDKSEDILDRVIYEHSLAMIDKFLDNISASIESAKVQPSIGISYAPRITRFELNSLVRKENMSAVELWHLLRGTEQWFQVSKHPLSVLGFYWSVGYYSKNSNHARQHSNFEVFKRLGRYYIQYKEISIELNTQWSIHKVFKK